MNKVPNYLMFSINITDLHYDLDLIRAFHLLENYSMRFRLICENPNKEKFNFFSNLKTIPLTANKGGVSYQEDDKLFYAYWDLKDITNFKENQNNLGNMKIKNIAYINVDNDEILNPEVVLDNLNYMKEKTNIEYIQVTILDENPTNSKFLFKILSNKETNIKKVVDIKGEIKRATTRPLIDFIKESHYIPNSLPCSFCKFHNKIENKNMYICALNPKTKVNLKKVSDKKFDKIMKKHINEVSIVKDSFGRKISNPGYICPIIAKKYKNMFSILEYVYCKSKPLYEQLNQQCMPQQNRPQQNRPQQNRPQQNRSNLNVRGNDKTGSIPLEIEPKEVKITINEKLFSFNVNSINETKPNISEIKKFLEKLDKKEKFKENMKYKFFIISTKNPTQEESKIIENFIKITDVNKAKIEFEKIILLENNNIKDFILGYSKLKDGINYELRLCFIEK